jgi:hypothetical protein
MKIRNFTPHSIVFRHEDGHDTVFESEGSIRIQTKTEIAESIDGFKSVRIVADKENTVLPAREDGVFFIVSGMVRENFPDRKDFISPATDPAHVIRGENGFVEAVKAFVRN